MPETRKLRFQLPRGYNGAIIARGALIDVAEPWASRFIADGTAVEESNAGKPKPEAKTADSSPAKAKPKPAPKGKKKNG